MTVFVFYWIRRILIRTQWSPSLLVVGLGDLRHLHCVVDYEIHEFVETLVAKTLEPEQYRVLS
jgi:hypothetical protein